jgi:hypothetical protein
MIFQFWKRKYLEQTWGAVTPPVKEEKNNNLNRNVDLLYLLNQYQYQMVLPEYVSMHNI